MFYRDDLETHLAQLHFSQECCPDWTNVLVMLYQHWENEGYSTIQLLSSQPITVDLQQGSTSMQLPIGR